MPHMHTPGCALTLSLLHSATTDKAKLTKASKEIAREARLAIENFVQVKAEEDATKQAESVHLRACKPPSPR